MGFEPTTPTLARLCSAHFGGGGRATSRPDIIAARLLAEKLQKVVF